MSSITFISQAEVPPEIRGWNGLGGWALWLVGWTSVAGIMQDFAGEDGKVFFGIFVGFGWFLVDMDGIFLGYGMIWMGFFWVEDGSGSWRRWEVLT